MDLNPFGIEVGAIHPGMVQTGAFPKERASNVYKGFDPLQPEDIVSSIL
jgi:NADP-dependent 3-hydroxy acid dehydrogenase YdfG